MATKKFPPITKSFSDAWEATKDNLLNMLFLNLIMLGVFVLFFVVLMIVGGIFGGLVFANFAKTAMADITKPQQMLALIGSMSTLMIATVIGSSFIGYWFHAASVLLLGKNDKDMSAGSALAKATPFIIPLFVTNLVVLYLLIGSLGLLVLPAILFGFFLIFVNMEVVLGGKNFLAAVKGSVTIVTQNFGDVFVRGLAYILVYLGIAVFIPNLIFRIEPVTGASIKILEAILAWVFTWYGQAYFIAVYKQAKTVTDTSKQSNLVGMFIASTIGWLLVIGTLVLGINLIRNNAKSWVENAEKNSEIEQLQKEFPEFSLTPTPSMKPTKVVPKKQVVK